MCGCFFCEETFSPTEITEWIDKADTALCPKCGINSVIGDASGLPVSGPTFLREMHDYWFRPRETPSSDKPTG